MNSTTGSMSGPSGPPQMMNASTPGSATTPGGTSDRSRLQLHTYMYEYFLKNEQYGLAKLLSDSMPVRLRGSPKQSPDKKEVNGEDADADSKLKDLPQPDIAHSGDEPFLLAWWGQFWDCFTAARNQGSVPARQYLEMIKHQRMANGQRGSINPQTQLNLRNQMMQNGGMTEQMKKAAMSGRPFTASQVRNHQMMQQQAQMNREGSGMEMTGPDGQPIQNDFIPSPKRQRLNDGSFGFPGGPMGQMGPMGPMGRGQPQGMPGRPLSQAELNQRLLARGIDVSTMSEQQANALRQQVAQAAQLQGGMGMPNGQPQGSPGMDPNGMRVPGGMPGAQKNTGALQDYQMQLMLLEQQNKKRLLMARQEQDNVSNGQAGHQPGAPGAPGMPGAGFGQPMSPSGSRAGRSPSASEDQLKRSGTPQMGIAGLQQAGDGQNFSSPSGGFDAGQMPGGMNPGMFPQMAKMGGMVGPQGQQMPSATSHPGFNGQMNGQFNPQMEAMRQQQQANARANGATGPNGPNAAMMPMNQQGAQVAPNMTPQQRNAAMPPPPAPGQGDATRTNPSSPQPFNAPAPPTPAAAPAAKAAPKKKEPAKKKAANKKNAAAAAAAAATPAASESGEPAQAATPAAAPPMTPTPANQTVPKPGTANSAAAAAAPAAAAAAHNAAPAAPATMAPQSAGGDMMNPDSFGLDSGEYAGMDLSFARVGDGGDVLDNFDFDSFLNNDGAGDSAFAFDVNMNFDEGANGGAGGAGAAGGHGTALETGAAATDV